MGPASSFLPTADAAPGDPWRDIDFAAPLEERVLKEETRDGVFVRRLRFYSHTVDGQRVMVYAIYGRPAQVPEGEGLPGLLHIHGGTQTASLKDVLFFGRRGYAVLTFDWTGPKDQRRAGVTTVWPESVNAEPRGGDDDRKGRIWHIVVAARRGLTYLEGRPEVDGGRLGVYGVSWGGFSTWLVNGSDRRVKVAVPVYGVGTALKAEMRGDWFDRYQPIRFAKTQSGPVLFCNGSNDFFGQLDVVEEVLAAAPAGTRRSVAPNEDHGLNRGARVAAWRWIDQHLKGAAALSEAPGLTTRREGKQLTAIVEAPSAARCRLLYAFGDAPSPRLYWNVRDMRRDGDAFTAPVPNVRPERLVRIFANAEYADGFLLSSRAVSIRPDEFEGSPLRLDPTDILFDPADGPDAWYSSWMGGTTELSPSDRRLVSAKSAVDGRPCVACVREPGVKTPCVIYLRAPRCPNRSARGATGLSIELNTTGVRGLQVRLYTEDRGRTFDTTPLTHQARLPQEAGWTTLRLGAGDFSDRANRSPKDMSSVLEIGLSIHMKEGASAEIGRLRWTRP